MSGVGSPAFLPPAKFVRSPEAMDRNWSVKEATAYTRWLAQHHYENFHVVSFLLPRRLHQDFYNVYAYCRWADDLADEIVDPAESLRLLAWWRSELDSMYRGLDQSSATHPVFAALAGTVTQYGIPRQPFSDLIDAFVQDQTVTRYRNWDELFAYCRNSANPVGRLVLCLCGYRDAARQHLSDATCTALQLANFWQDVTVDLRKDRVYIPLEVMERHGYTLEELFARRFTPAFAGVMREIVARARHLCLHALLRRSERRSRRFAFRRRPLARRHGRGAPGPLRGPSRVARLSPHSAPFRHPARVFPPDDRRHFVRSRAAHPGVVPRVVPLLLPGGVRRGVDHHPHLRLRYAQRPAARRKMRRGVF